MLGSNGFKASMQLNTILKKKINTHHHADLKKSSTKLLNLKMPKAW